VGLYLRGAGAEAVQVLEEHLSTADGAEARAQLEAMAETRSEAAAFERVYDRGPAEERAAWREALLAR
jgi:hypothetical protein